MLKGQWLNELGFGYGTPVCVECSGGKLVITRADEIEATFTEIGTEPVAAVFHGSVNIGKGGGTGRLSGLTVQYVGKFYI